MKQQRCGNNVDISDTTALLLGSFNVTQFENQVEYINSTTTRQLQTVNTSFV
uniref:Uncharacterized protein n=1 Tax=Arion vulgaris TaxID=1028688 RepID=A0A0B7AU30_9EUPU